MCLKFQTLSFAFSFCSICVSLRNPKRNIWVIRKWMNQYPPEAELSWGKIPRYGEQISMNINNTAVRRESWDYSGLPWIPAVSTAWRLKGLLWAEKSLSSVFLNKVIFISVESESQSQLDLCKIQPEDIPVSSKGGLMELHLDAETFGIFVAISILGAMWHLNTILRKKMNSVNCGILCYLAILKSRCETHGWDRHYPGFLRGFLNLNRKKFNFIVKVKSVKKYKYKMFSLEQIIYLKRKFLLRNVRNQFSIVLIFLSSCFGWTGLFPVKSLFSEGVFPNWLKSDWGLIL